MGRRSLPSGPALAARGSWRMCSLKREVVRLELVAVEWVEGKGCGMAPKTGLLVVGVEVLETEPERGYRLRSLMSPVAVAAESGTVPY
jgi:hypothetical protein